MKRDRDYIREFLLKAEDRDEYFISMSASLDMTKEDMKRVHHMYIMIDDGLLAKLGKTTVRLTSKGHDFIDVTRDDGIWNRTKEAVADTGGNATLEIIKNVASALLKKKIKDHTGLDI